MPSASVSLFAASVLGLFAICYGAPLDIVQSSQNLATSAQTSSYNQESYNVVDNPVGPDYVSYDSSSGSSSSQSLEYDSNYLSATDNGLYSTGNSLYQQEQQQIEQEYSSNQQIASEYSNLGSSVISQQQQQQEYSYNQQQSSLNQVVSI